MGSTDLSGRPSLRAYCGGHFGETLSQRLPYDHALHPRRLQRHQLSLRGSPPAEYVERIRANHQHTLADNDPSLLVAVDAVRQYIREMQNLSDLVEMPAGVEEDAWARQVGVLEAKIIALERARRLLPPDLGPREAIEE